MLDWLEPIHIVALCCGLPILMIWLYTLLQWADRTVYLLLNAPAWLPYDEEE